MSPSAAPSLSPPPARKRHRVGFETELLVLEENGAVSTRADALIERAQAARLPFPVHKEYTHNMIEIASVANLRVRKGAHGWLRTMQRIIDIARPMGLRLYPYGTYPGTHIPTTRTDDYYRMCESVMGPARYAYSTGHAAGFHFHYCLPYGTFNRGTRQLRQLFRSKYRDDLLSLYNFILAADPALTNFMESSPFIDGLHLAKDSRVMAYRSMRVGRLGRGIEGLYADMPLFGELPRYASSLSDLIMLTDRRHRTWTELVEERCPQYQDLLKTRHPLQFNWGPLRINRVGTLEYRGLDMNLPGHLLGTSLLLKYGLKRVRTERLTVRPSDLGIKKPFLIEDGVVHVPPHSYLSEVLQPKSALRSLEDPEVYRYSRQMAQFAIEALPDRRDPGLERVRSILRTRRTQSDEILSTASKAGHSGSRLDEDVARRLALDASDRLEREVRSMLDRDLAIDLEE